MKAAAQPEAMPLQYSHFGCTFARKVEPVSVTRPRPCAGSFRFRLPDRRRTRPNAHRLPRASCVRGRLIVGGFTGFFWRGLDAALALALQPLSQKVNRMSQQLDTLTADTTALQGAITQLIAQDDANTDALKALIAKGGATPEDLTAVITASEAAKAQIVADLTRNAVPASDPGTSAPSA